jgi:class 3 adenylate cyclase
VNALGAYLPQDRLRALARGAALPDRTSGAALFADISGFTPLAERLARELGPRRGVEELTQRLNTVYDALITQVERFGGSVISFAGDAITCWFDETLYTEHRAVACAARHAGRHGRLPDLALGLPSPPAPPGRLVVGDPAIRLIDTLAGATIARLAAAERLADPAPCSPMKRRSRSRRAHASGARTVTGEHFAVVTPPMPRRRHHRSPAARRRAVDRLRPGCCPRSSREQSGQAISHRVTSVITLFLHFTGIDYDRDEQAGAKLDAFIRRVQAVIARHDGSLLEIIIGDKGNYLYCAFGAPVAHEDDRGRAVQAALELQRLPLQLSFLRPLQIGISRGTLRVGTYGSSTRRSYSAQGDDANLSARLCCWPRRADAVSGARSQLEVV